LVLPGGHGFWALLAMAAMLGGTMRSPLTGAVFALELTGDYAMLAPLLAASTAAYAVTVLLLKRSILTEKIARRGQHITREYAVDPYELARVADVMIAPVDSLAADLTIREAVAELEAGRHRIYPVVDAAGRPVGLVSRAEALRWEVELDDEGGDLGRERLADRISDADLACAHPEDIVARAVEVMIAREMGRLPVTDAKTGVLVGLLTRKTLLQVRAAAVRAEADRQAFFGA
jgi:CBS domain-containing protein